MADINKTIDRSMAISRNVAGTLSRRVKDAYSTYGESVRQALLHGARPPGVLGNPSLLLLLHRLREGDEPLRGVRAPVGARTWCCCG